MSTFRLNRRFSALLRRFSLTLVALTFSVVLSAGEKSGKHEPNEEDIKREISFLAKKLIDMSGEDSVVIESAAVVKPFIGVCSSIQRNGVKLTCITPESQADKNGLKTGDVISAINGISMSEQENKDRMHAYWGIVKSMSTGDVLKLDVVRGGAELKLEVTVGSLSHPAFTLEIRR